jgi:RNA 3'-terminal phosphate cyclase
MASTKQQMAAQYVASGLSYQQAADLVGLTRSAVAGACRRRGVKVGKRGYTPQGKASVQAYWQRQRQMKQEAHRGQSL